MYGNLYFQLMDLDFLKCFMFFPFTLASCEYTPKMPLAKSKITIQKLKIPQLFQPSL